jgi:sigma-B regulation protein RsbU (phosphoserine phosphatase)
MSETRRFCWEVTVDGSGMSPSGRVRLKERATVGRDEGNDISFPDAMVSRRHAELQQRDGSLYVVDLDSTNGTYVNDFRIHGEKILRDGDVVTVGGLSLVCHETACEGESPDEVAHGAVKTTLKRSSTMRAIRKMVDVDELVHEDRSLGVVCQVANTLVAHHPLPEIFDRVLAAVLEAIPAQRAAIILLEGEPAVPRLKTARMRAGVDMGEIRQDVVQRVLEERKAFLVRDTFDDPTPREPSVGPADRIQSVMCAPLWSPSTGRGKGRMLGLIYLDNLSDRPPLADRDLYVLIVLANIAATKIENAHLAEESLQNQRIEEDMRLAATIQADLLPPGSPVVPGYVVCGMTAPCRLVGGDYFDFEHDDQTLHIALADVSGKGIGAAMLMVALRATVRAHWRDGALTEATARINRTFHQTVPSDKYATFFIARLERASGRLDYVNAGHNRPLLVGPDGQWRRLEVGGTVVGAFPETTYEQESVVVEPGACLLVFSDGISDAWRSQEDADHHLVQLAVGRRRGDVSALRSEIFRSVEHSNDDRTLIIVERLAGATAPALERAPAGGRS